MLLSGLTFKTLQSMSLLSILIFLNFLQTPDALAVPDHAPTVIFPVPESLAVCASTSVNILRIIQALNPKASLIDS